VVLFLVYTSINGEYVANRNRLANLYNVYYEHTDPRPYCLMTRVHLLGRSRLHPSVLR